ncbi:MAG: DUF1045 domain-containing protein [Phyllobacterium sp.]
MRYAIYFTPSSSDPLLRVAANWLGRNAFSGKPVKTPHIRGLGLEQIARITEEPRRYGFHATLKAPFRLAEGFSEADLLRALMAFGNANRRVTIPKLEIAPLGKFFAVVPSEPLPELQRFASEIVVAFDRFRAPLTEADRARRKSQKLTPSQAANLEYWGYPYVHDDFRFHMTLTGPIDEKDQPGVEQILADFFAPVLDEPAEISNLALFVEPEPGAPFEIHSLHPLTATDMRKTA